MSTDSPNQWKIDNARRLSGCMLHLQPYKRWSNDWYHDHCAACWAKFADFEGPEVLHEGYATGPDHPKGTGYAWVCPLCFEELADMLKWKSA
jgi:hypothetical protein